MYRRSSYFVFILFGFLFACTSTVANEGKQNTSLSQFSPVFLSKDDLQKKLNHYHLSASKLDTSSNQFSNLKKTIVLYQDWIDFYPQVPSYIGFEEVRRAHRSILGDEKIAMQKRREIMKILIDKRKSVAPNFPIRGEVAHEKYNNQVQFYKWAKEYPEELKSYLVFFYTDFQEVINTY